MTGRTELPPSSPALTVHEAAARIRRAAERARFETAVNEYWRVGWAAGIENAVGGAPGELTALFPPELAIEFADWLDTVASHNARYGTPLPEFALTVTAAVPAP